MVSPLSSRIYNLEAKARIKNFKHLSKIPEATLPWQIENRTKRISGYIADRESPSVVVNAEKQNRADMTEAHAKKRKNEELNFQAYNVKNDLASAGVDFVPRSKALPEGSIDMSGVTHIMSSQYTESETDKCESNPDLCKTSYELSTDYCNLVEASKVFYNTNVKRKKIVPKFPKNVSKALSFTSSTTNGTSTSLSSSPCLSEAEDGSTQSQFVLPKIIEDPPQHSDDTMLGFLSSANDNFTTLEEALNSSNTARLIVESKEPYRIIHSNASFSQLCGAPSNLVSGTSLLKFAMKRDKNNLPSKGTIDLLCIPPETTDILTCDINQAQGDGLAEVISCHVVIYQVPSSTKTIRGCNRFSHYVLELNKAHKDHCDNSTPCHDTEDVKDNGLSTEMKSPAMEKDDAKQQQKEASAENQRRPSYAVG
jgi:hypothetical protein